MTVELSTRQAKRLKEIVVIRRRELSKLGKLFGKTEPRNLEIGELDSFISLLKGGNKR